MLSRFFYIRITPGFFGRGEGADFFPTVLTRIFSLDKVKVFIFCSIKSLFYYCY